VVSLLIGLALLREFDVIEISLPERATLVPRSVLDRAPDQAAIWFGFELGLGFRTRVPSTAPYLLAAALLLLATSPLVFFGTGLAFGIGRFVMAAERYASPDGDDWDWRLDQHKVAIRRVGTATGVVGLLFLLV